MVGRQAADLRRAHGVGAVVDGRAGEVERRQRARQGGGQFHGAGGLQDLGGDDVDGGGGFGHGAVGDAGTGDDHRVQGLRTFGGFLCQHRAGEQGQEDGGSEG